MNNLTNVAHESLNVLRKNSPKLLLGGGIFLGAGAIAATGIASFKAADIVKDIQCDPRCDDRKVAAKEYFKRVVPLYIPVMFLSAGSVVCLVKSYDINAKRLAAATALVEVSAETLRLYKEKAKEVLGEEKAKELEKEVKKEKDILKEQEPSNGNYDIQWFRDELTGQEFISTKDAVKSANLEFMARLNVEMMLSVNEWLDILDDYTLECQKDPIKQLSHTLDGDERGWESGYPIYVYTNDVCMGSKGQSCIKLTYSLPPKPNYRHHY